MADALPSIGVVLGAIVSLAASWVLVGRLERIGARAGLSEALLGMLAALAADGPEVTSAVAALVSGQSRIGAGVVLGSNVFNLAALLGLSAVVAGRIALHRRVLVFEGSVAIVIAGIAVAVVAGSVPPALGAVACGVILAPYIMISSNPTGQEWLPVRWRDWLAEAVAEEEGELAGTIDTTSARRIDVAVAFGAVLAVIGASVAMEQAASTLGERHAVPQIVIGGLVLAAVTSFPNAVSAIYLASRGRGSATLSAALNSNSLNVVAGLLLPAAVVGLGAPSGQSALITAWYAGFTILVLGVALAGRGLRRQSGVAIVVGYAAFIAVVLAVA